MELLHDMKKWEHQFMHYEHNLMLSIKHMFRSEMFWILLTVCSLIVAAIIIAMMSNGNVNSRLLDEPYWLYLMN